MERQEFENNIKLGIRNLIEPFLEKLKTERQRSRQEMYIEMIEKNLKQFAHSTRLAPSAKISTFSKTEMQVAAHIRDALTNKEISGILNISVRTAEFHRRNIRKKLGLQHKKTNLRSYLSANQHWLF